MVGLHVTYCYMLPGPRWPQSGQSQGSQLGQGGEPVQRWALGASVEWQKDVGSRTDCPDQLGTPLGCLARPYYAPRSLCPWRALSSRGSRGLGSREKGEREGPEEIPHLIAVS